MIDDLNFGNEFRLSSIRGQKFSDDDSNGQRDVDLETGISSNLAWTTFAWSIHVRRDGNRLPPALTSIAGASDFGTGPL